MPSDIPPVLSAGEVRGITQCVSCVYVCATELSLDQNLLDCTFPVFHNSPCFRKTELNNLKCLSVSLKIVRRGKVGSFSYVM